MERFTETFALSYRFWKQAVKASEDRIRPKNSATKEDLCQKGSKLLCFLERFLIQLDLGK
jgi:hypothetical protein